MALMTLPPRRVLNLLRDCELSHRNSLQARCRARKFGHAISPGTPPLVAAFQKLPKCRLKVQAVSDVAKAPASLPPASPVLFPSDLSHSRPPRAAFFDVDGTITSTNVVEAFVALRLRDMPAFQRVLWQPWFALNVVVYIALDRIDRALFNRTFYRNYRGMAVREKESMAEYVHEAYLKSKLFPGVEAYMSHLRASGYHIVLVTGSLDFLVHPLACDLHASAVFAARLQEEDGRFTGELEGEAVSSGEKAAAVRRYARQQGMDLALCRAYGDSIADVDMLIAVGRAFAVRPDKRLRREAEERGWFIVEGWSDLESVHVEELQQIME